MTPLLAVEQLSWRKVTGRGWFRKPSVFYLKPVTFSLQPGETMAIVGENGSGKSALAKLLVGAEIPTSGSIQLNGKPLATNNLKQRCLKVRMIFQHSQGSLNPALNIGSLLDEPLKLNTDLSPSDRKEKIIQTLTQVGLLPEHFHYYRHMLSEGQRQRAALARALILNPQVIVADEPFAALDPSVRSQTINLLLRLQDELGLGFIFISHNIGIVRHISDRVLVMREGEVIESGKTNDIFTWPKTEYSKKIVSSYQALTKNQSR